MDEQRVSMQCRVADDSGEVLDATVTVEETADTPGASIVLESAGNSGAGARNPDYAQALCVILERLAQAPVSIELTGAEIDSTATRHLSNEERRLQLARYNLPLALSDVTDFESLRRDLTRAQRTIGQAPGASGGNERKRMRLHVRSDVGELPLEDVIFLIGGLELAVNADMLTSQSAFLLTWNPSLWTWDDRAEEVSQSQAGRLLRGRWSTGNRTKGIKPGDRAFLLQQGTVRGLVGTGYFASEVFQDLHWDGTGRQANYALVIWDDLASEEDRLPIEQLRSVTEDVPWDNIQSSGIAVSPKDARAIETAWEGLEAVFVSPEEESASSILEGSVSRVEVNRYERSPVARRRCLEHYGYACSVCGLNFKEEYGDIGTDFIHVHHLVELSSIGSDYEVDPVKDLRPVCPNCHAMLHKRRPAYTIEEMRAIRRGHP